MTKHGKPSDADWDAALSQADRRSMCDDMDCDGETHACWFCDGTGQIVGDCGEDACCCADPEADHPRYTCKDCGGTGRFPCPELTRRVAKEEGA